MRRMLKIALRCLVVIAVLTMVPLALIPSSPGGSPYMSSLSITSIGVVLADPNCHNKGCDGTGGCAPNQGHNCNNPGGTQHCITETC